MLLLLLLAFALDAVVVAAANAPACELYTRQECLQATEQCVWKRQGLVPNMFRCEENILHPVKKTHSSPRTTAIIPSTTTNTRPEFSCKHTPIISHILESPCFAQQSKWSLVQDCGCNSVNEVTYLLPARDAAPRADLVLNHTTLLQRARIVFIHVNKAAGSTIKSILLSSLAHHQWDGAAYGSIAGWKFFNPALPLTSSEHDASSSSASALLRTSLTPDEGEVMYAQCGNRFANAQQCTEFVHERGYALAQAQVCPLRLVWGSRGMGLCDTLPAGEPCVYFTAIRDPISRALSDYAYFCLEGAENRHKWTDEMRAQGKCTLSPFEWFREMKTTPYFLVERLTTGCDAQCGLKAAMANLLHPCMRYILVEQFEDGMRKLRESFGPVFSDAIDAYLDAPVQRNVANVRSSSTSNDNEALDRITAEDIQKLRVLLKDDILLYQTAVRHYHEQWAKPLESCKAFVA